jgi:hypothetical protein
MYVVGLLHENADQVKDEKLSHLIRSMASGRCKEI